MIAPQRWYQLSLAQQMGHVGSELGRARHWESKGDRQSRDHALVRALDLLDLTLNDRRWSGRFRELARFREVVSDWFCGRKAYDVPAETLEGYCARLSLRPSSNLL